ncbi:MAG: hypothetical protein ACYC7A_11155 [Thermoanaerobaculia bacterium]
MRRIIISIAIAAVAMSAFGAPKKKPKTAPAPVTTLEASVSQVNDRRSTAFFSQLSIRLELGGITASEVSAAKVKITKAVDDTGRDLTDPEAGEPAFQPMPGPMSLNEDPERPAMLEVALKNPDRNAITVKEVMGDVEFYMPGKDPDAVAYFPKFKTMTGKPLTHRALKANGVEISIVSDAQIEADKKKAAEAKRKEAIAEGADEEMVEYAVSSVEEYYFKPEPGEFVLRIKDPNKRVHDLQFVTPSGEAQRLFSQEREGGYTVISSFGETVDVNWDLRVNLRTAKSVSRHKLELKDVELP